MNISEIIGALEATSTYLNQETSVSTIDNVFVSDMMSEVLTQDHENLLLITSLATPQVLRTVDSISGIGIILVDGKPLPAGMAELAAELGITLLHTKLTAFDVSVIIGKLMGR